MTPVHNELLVAEGSAPADVKHAPPSELTAGQWLALYARRVGRRWRLVLAITAATTIAAGLYSLLQPTQYSATATLYFPQTEPLNTALAIPTSQPADTEREANTNVALVTSPSVAGAVIKQLNLKLTVPRLLEKVQASVDSNSDLVSVSATASTAAGAAQVADEFARQDVAFRRDAVQAALAHSIVQATQAINSQPSGSHNTQVLETRLQQLKAARDLQTGPAQLLQPATIPPSPSSPHPLRIAALAFGLGLLFAILLALGLDLVDRRLTDEAEISDALGSPVLGVLPARPRRSKGETTPLDPTQRHAMALLASTLRLQDLDRGTILISGIAPDDDGHAEVALGMAAALTNSGHRVVVIQVGPQDSGLDRLLGLVDRPGLGSALQEPEQIVDSLLAISARTLGLAETGTPGPTFGLLPIGYASAEYEELSGPAMQALLLAAQAVADTVVLSVATVEHALAFADRTSSPLLVVRRNGPTLEVARQAAGLLRNAGIQPHGLVVTGGARPPLATFS